MMCNNILNITSALRLRLLLIGDTLTHPPTNPMEELFSDGDKTISLINFVISFVYRSTKTLIDK
jgi:hypothetical protein